MGHHPAADPAATAGRATIQQAIGAVLTRLSVFAARWLPPGLTHTRKRICAREWDIPRLKELSAMGA